MPMIRVASPVQKTLFICELRGQISDGNWENSRPYNHWKVPCSATVVVDPVKQGIDFYSRRYNFADSRLLEVVSDRMLMFCRARIQYPNVSEEAIRALDNGDWIWKDESGSPYRDHLIELGINSKVEADAVRTRLETIAYTMKDLRRDLKALSVTFRSAA